MKALPQRKHAGPIPKEFASYEEVAEFWDTHDTTDYPNAFCTVEAITELRRRSFEIELDEEVARILRAQARQKGVTASRLANDLLRQQLATVKLPYIVAFIRKLYE